MNTGISTITVYASHTFPTLTVAENIGTLSVLDTSQDCTSLRTISIATRPTESASFYFIEFSSLEDWVHLGEISFYDMPPTTSATESITTLSKSRHHNNGMQ